MQDKCIHRYAVITLSFTHKETCKPHDFSFAVKPVAVLGSNSNRYYSLL